MKMIFSAGVLTLFMASSLPTMAQDNTVDSTDHIQMADQGRGGREHGPGGHRGRHGGRMMQMIDTNGDGAVGEDEAAAMADHVFSRLDGNDDGSLSEAEFTAGPKRHRGWFNWSQAETDAVQKIRREKFASLDADKNSNLSKSEFFVEAKSRLAAADTDKDGKISPWEFRAQN